MFYTMSMDWAWLHKYYMKNYVTTMSVWTNSQKRWEKATLYE